MACDFSIIQRCSAKANGGIAAFDGCANVG
jgi:hypothetical protein